MNNNFALQNYALQICSKYDFKDYQTHVYDLDLDYNDFVGEYVIESIIEKSTKHNNYNKFKKEKALCFFTYTKDKKRVIFIKVESLEMKIKISLLLEDKSKIDDLLQNKKATEQESTDKIFYREIFENLNMEIKQINEPLPPVELLEKETPFNLRDIIDTKDFNRLQYSLPWAVGMRIDNTEYITNLETIQHLLIAGSKYSEINSCIRNIILSVLYKSSPNEVEFVFIGKKSERTLYRKMPHYHSPVSDIEDENFNLEILLKIMDDRYEKYAKNMAVNILDYNHKMPEENKDYYIVVIINDLKDLMTDKNSKEIESSIINLLQNGKAVGIHLILATKTPAEQVIPFDIRANIPSRLAFKLKSAEESDLILDCAGAEKLTGNGDMLFLPLFEQKPVHIQSAYVSSNEVENVMDFISKQEYN